MNEPFGADQLHDEPKFTPGPWKAHSVGDRYMKGDEIFEIHWSEDGECVAEIVHGANDAHLIAVAPKMYKELERVLKREYNPFEPDNQSDRYLRIEKLLKEARGET